MILSIVQCLYWNSLLLLLLINRPWFLLTGAGTTHSGVHVWASDPWHTAANARLANFYMVPSPKLTVAFPQSSYIVMAYRAVGICRCATTTSRRRGCREERLALLLAG